MSYLSLEKASEPGLARQWYKSFPLNSAHIWLHNDRQLGNKRPICAFALDVWGFFSFALVLGKGGMSEWHSVLA